MDEKRTYLYPTNFNPVKLVCNEEGSILFVHATQEVIYTQLALTSKLFEGSVFQGEVLDASDGGKKILVLYDTTLVAGQDISDSPYPVRLELVKNLFKDPDFFDSLDLSNEYTIRFPILIESHRVAYMNNVILPNLYGKCSGFGFTGDGFEKQGGRFEEGEFLIKRPRSKKPDVYEVFDTLYTPISGNKYLYIPNLGMSRKMSTLFKGKTSLRMKLEFDELHQKWKPLV